MCTANDDVVYQAKFLPSVAKTALEIRNTTQLWILTKPIIAIDEKLYQVDPSCSVVVQQLGMTSCDSNPSTEARLPDQNPSFGKSVVELVAVIGAGVLLAVVIMLTIILILCCICRRNSKKKRWYIAMHLSIRKLCACMTVHGTYNIIHDKLITHG